MGILSAIKTRMLAIGLNRVTCAVPELETVLKQMRDELRLVRTWRTNSHQAEKARLQRHCEELEERCRFLEYLTTQYQGYHAPFSSGPNGSPVGRRTEELQLNRHLRDLQLQLLELERDHPELSGSYYPTLW